MSEIERIENELSNLRERLAELETADGDAIGIGQQLRHDWRAASIRADVDGDEAAEAEAAELSQRLLNASLADERRRNAIAEIKNRIRVQEGRLFAARVNRPMRYFRRRPGVPVPALTQLARSLPGRLGGSGWEEISEDRFRYELGRGFGGDGGSVERDLRLSPGRIAAAWDFELRCELVE